MQSKVVLQVELQQRGTNVVVCMAIAVANNVSDR
jgi:hypothetical protein